METEKLLNFTCEMGRCLLRNGADAVVFPERELGYWTAIRYSSDNIADYVELSDGYAIFEISIPDRWNGKKVGDLDVRRKFHINILGIRSESDNYASYNRFKNSPHKKGIILLIKSMIIKKYLFGQSINII